MNKLNKLFKEVYNEIDRIKTNQSDIEMSDLIEFSSMYFNCQNWVLDLINHITIKEIENRKNLEFADKYESQIMDFFMNINKYNYNRLIIDTLLELNTKKSINYTKKIIDNSPKNKEQFVIDFQGHPYFKKMINEMNL